MSDDLGVDMSTAATERAGQSGERRGPIPGDLLLHPVAIAALVVVIFNDRWLKVHYPGAVSGKLSDVAGLVYFPLFVAALIELARRLLRRAVWAASPRLVDVLALITGVIFALAKVWSPWADAYRRAFGAVWWPIDATRSIVGGHGWPPLGRLGLTQDWTDLVALPALLVPPLIARRVTAARGASETVGCH